MQAAADIPAATAAAGGALTSESGGILGWCKWVGYQALGLALALPMSLELLVRFITKWVLPPHACQLLSLPFIGFALPPRKPAAWVAEAPVRR
jgi:hypothetical protein